MQSLYLEGGLFGGVLGNVMPPAASAPPVANVMFKDTILWVSDTQQNSVAARLESAGFTVLSARVREALAVLFVNRSIDVVVVNAGSSALDTLIRGLRAIRPDIPIFLVTSDPNTTASSIDGCFVVTDPALIAPQLHAAMLKPAV